MYERAARPTPPEGDGRPASGGKEGRRLYGDVVTGGRDEWHQSSLTRSRLFEKTVVQKALREVTDNRRFAPSPVSRNAIREEGVETGARAWIMRRVDVGYVRVSKREQNPDLQRRELAAAGCKKVSEERISSRGQTRPQLEAARTRG